ncbi:MAG: molybdopterin dinucleotide binding domain-containing protein [Candidatus Acidiferrales bacterium]
MSDKRDPQSYAVNPSPSRAEGLDRRRFLQVVAAASAGALAACRSEPARKLIPYVVPPEEITPGVSTWYKSVCRECPAGCGVMVRTREARALKVEGNPDHPVNRGKLCVRGQAALQGLYNPDRIAQPLRRNARGQLEPISWAEGERILADLLRYLRHEGQAHRIALISHRVTGSLDKFFREWLALFGSDRYLQYEPFAYEAIRAANQLTFGTSEIPHYDIARAKFLLNFGADFLETWVSNVAFTRDFAAFRRDPARRYVHVEARRSLTAANADEWLPVLPGTQLNLVLGMIREIVRSGLSRGLSASEATSVMRATERFELVSTEMLSDGEKEAVRRLARQFAAARPGLAIGGGVGASDEVVEIYTQAGINLLNYVCGNVGETVRFGQGIDYDRVATFAQMHELSSAMHRDEILAAFFHHANPLFTMPSAPGGFEQALARVPFKVSFSSYLDETTAVCDLVLPDHTPLERWEDYQPRAGVFGLAQPTMQPVFDTKQAPDVLLSVAKQVEPTLAQRLQVESFYDYMRNEWRGLHRQVAPRQDFEEFWRLSVESGGGWREVPEQAVRLNPGVLREPFPVFVHLVKDESEVALVGYPSIQLFDGRGANRPWLQELPEPLSKITWNGYAEIHPDTAAQRAIQEGDVLRLFSGNRSIELPAHLTEGIHRGVVAVPLGQGHMAYGRYAQGAGANAYKLLPADPDKATHGRAWTGRVRIEKLEVRRRLAKTQLEDRQHGRGFAQAIAASELSKPHEPEPYKFPMLYPEHEHKVHRWGMVVDLDACVGCNACVAACYAENNIPVVGEHEVARGHHMAWIRIERYYEEREKGQPDDVRFVPMMCQQCDNAPCESVCPVYATYHNPEGLNVQVYNRCVGTRYCSNNCPYKVRRFNWFDWQWPAPLDLQLNPDVSQRSKGIMEKCTFCIQRIREAKDHARDDGRKVRDGEITPACVQTCPADALMFGDWLDPESRINKTVRDNPRAYHILGEINTRPAITYLKKVIRRGEEG